MALSQERPDKKWESLTQILGNFDFLSCYLRLKMHAKVRHFLLSILDIKALVCRGHRCVFADHFLAPICEMGPFNGEDNNKNPNSVVENLNFSNLMPIK